ncbi:LexA family protein [Candidatus Odyssella thessalonicensis]|uniref:LexA family protein n=1 Tax=Candidatus Odyssella thessalonicensis TaxID=84647 RepID=UPI000225B4FB|nr:translesion error-prone DNA polymerase V autoproteolytic subunit [Candidatus Odyssella thessalonicensis]
MNVQIQDSIHYLPSIGLLKFDSSLDSIITPRNSKVYLTLFSSRVQAGFPSPADDYAEKSLDLNEHLISHPAATFFVRVSGDSMIGAGIHNDDILVVDRSLKAKHNSIVIAVLNGELTVKRLKIYPDKCVLAPENPAYKNIVITPEMDFTVWGVVTSVVHQFI